MRCAIIWWSRRSAPPCRRRQFVRIFRTRFPESFPWRTDRLRDTISSMENPRGQLKVLIADDSMVVRERLATLLEDLPGVCIVAATGSLKETEGAIKLWRPDLVIVDLTMPDGNALDVIRQAQLEQAETDVLVMTNFPCPEYEQRALDLGARAFFDKSQEFMKVRTLVEQLARQSHDQCQTLEVKGA